MHPLIAVVTCIYLFFLVLLFSLGAFVGLLSFLLSTEPYPSEHDMVRYYWRLMNPVGRVLVFPFFGARYLGYVVVIVITDAIKGTFAAIFLR